MRAEEIIKLLEEQFPPSLAMDWDNSGLQVGSRKTEVKKVCDAEGSRSLRRSRGRSACDPSSADAGRASQGKRGHNVWKKNTGDGRCGNGALRHAYEL